MTGRGLDHNFKFQFSNPRERKSFPESIDTTPCSCGVCCAGQASSVEASSQARSCLGNSCTYPCGASVDSPSTCLRTFCSRGSFSDEATRSGAPSSLATSRICTCGGSFSSTRTCSQATCTGCPSCHAIFPCSNSGTCRSLTSRSPEARAGDSRRSQADAPGDNQTSARTRGRRTSEACRGRSCNSCRHRGFHGSCRCHCQGP